MILPRVKSKAEAVGAFKGELIFDSKGESAQRAVRLLSLFLPAAEIKSGAAPNVRILEREEQTAGAYELEVAEREITVSQGDYEGLRNAMATLAQMLRGGRLPCCEIKDAPDNSFRSCMLDLARGYVELPVLREQLLRMALLKYNHVHFHLMDRQSYVLESEVVPNPDGHRQYTRREMSELVEYCRLLAIEVIPEIEIPAHAVNQIKALPELACDIIDRRRAVEAVKAVTEPRKREFTDNKRCVSSWVVCAGKESTYEIYARIVQELCRVFDGKYIHIGGDEMRFDHLAAHSHWDNCHACKKRMEAEGITELRELYCYVIRRMHEIVTSCGKKMMMWNDQLDVFNPIDIPKDTVIEYWNGGVITDRRGVLAALAEQGFTVINAHYRYTYVDFPEYMQQDKLKHWSTHTDMLGETEVKGNIIGGEMCAWELGNPLYSFYGCSLPICTALFADRVWNNEGCEYGEEYRKALFSVAVGCFECDADPLRFFRELIPPRDKAKNAIEEIDLDAIDRESLNGVLSELSSLSNDRVYGGLALGELTELLRTAADTIK